MRTSGKPLLHTFPPMRHGKRLVQHVWGSNKACKPYTLGGRRGNQFLWGYDPSQDAELQQVFNYVVSRGVTLFDTADSYGAPGPDLGLIALGF